MLRYNMSSIFLESPSKYPLRASMVRCMAFYRSHKSPLTIYLSVIIIYVSYYYYSIISSKYIYYIYYCNYYYVSIKRRIKYISTIYYPSTIIIVDVPIHYNPFYTIIIVSIPFHYNYHITIFAQFLYHAHSYMRVLYIKPHP
jgi:hypothetical protein